MLLLLLALGAGAPASTTSDGAAIYKEHCAACHDKPVPRVPSVAAIRGLSPRRIVNSLESGTMMMPGRRLTPEGRRAVAEFLTGKSFAVEAPRERSVGLCETNPPFELSGSGAVWNGWSNDPLNRRFQASPGFTIPQLPRLRLKWAFGFDGDVVAFGQPALAGGRVFVGSAGGVVYSLDAATGCKYWEYDAEAAVRTAVVLVSLPDGRRAACFGDLHAIVYAVDASSGALIWKKNLDSHPAARITGAPAFHEGRLFVPVSSFEEGMASHPDYECCTFRGSVAALDVATGAVRWQRHLVDRTPRPNRRNRQGRQMHGPSGVAVWSAPTLDVKRGLLYVTTGDNYSEPATPLSDAVVAMRMQDGAIAWSRQLTPNDVWNAACMGDKVNCPDEEGPDADFGSSAILATAPGGRQLLVAAQKSGMVYALDPAARGRIVWQVRAGKGGLLGGIQWGHAADGEKVYAPIGDMVIPEPVTTGGGLVAIGLADGKVQWRAAPPVCGDRRPCSPAQMAAATVIPGAVFSGARDGFLRAYSTADGKVLWSFDTMRQFETVNKVEARGGAFDGPGPVIAGGMLFVNSGYAFWNGAPGNVLLAFSVAD